MTLQDIQERHDRLCTHRKKKTWAKIVHANLLKDKRRRVKKDYTFHGKRPSCKKLKLPARRYNMGRKPKLYCALGSPLGQGAPDT